MFGHACIFFLLMYKWVTQRTRIVADYTSFSKLSLNVDSRWRVGNFMVNNSTFEAHNSINVLEERETAFSVGLLAVIVITCR